MLRCLDTIRVRLVVALLSPILSSYEHLHVSFVFSSSFDVLEMAIYVIHRTRAKVCVCARSPRPCVIAPQKIRTRAKTQPIHLSFREGCLYCGIRSVKTCMHVTYAGFDAVVVNVGISAHVGLVRVVPLVIPLLVGCSDVFEKL